MKRLALYLAALLISLSGYAQIPQYATPLGTGGNSYPFQTTGQRTQLLYPPTDFSSPPTGFITAIYFRANSVPSSTASYTGFEVAMGSVGSMTSFTAGPWLTGLNVLIPSQTYTMTGIVAGTPSANNGWVKIALPTPFYYDNTQSLVVDVKQSSAANGFTVFNTNLTGSNRRMFGTTATASADAYRYDFGFDIFAGYPCVDTPKTELAGPDKVCPGDTFSITPATFYANATYQYQYSNNGVTWSNFTGPVGLYSDIKDAIQSQKWYRCKVYCNANPSVVYITKPKRVTIAPFYYCYCKNRAEETNNGADIGNLTIYELPNSDTVFNYGSTFPQVSNNKAVNKYTSHADAVSPIVFYRGKEYVFAVTQINFNSALTPNVASVYLDYNRDGLFDETTERLFDKYTNAITGVAFDSFKIPGDAKIGLTGLRVILGNTDPSKPCGIGPGDGEVEDYLADIRWDPCTGPINPGVLTGDTSVCVGYDYVVRNERYENELSSFTRAWQISGDNIKWMDIPASVNVDEIPRVFNGQPLYYRVRAICDVTQDTTYTPEAYVNLKDGYKCYCFSQARGGNAGDSSDIGGFTFAGMSHTDGGTHLLNIAANRKRSDFTDNTPIDMEVDSMYKLTVFHTMRTALHGDAKITVFMDFNNNNQYDIPEDLVYTGYTSLGNFTVIDSVSVKPDAIRNVPTGMRVILNNDMSPSRQSDSACGEYISGETEDYMIMFRNKGFTHVGTLSAAHVKIYPNPTTGKFLVNYSGNTNIEKMHITITSVTGQVVYEQEHGVGTGTFSKELDLSNVSKGVYFVRLKANGQESIQKLVIE